MIDARLLDAVGSLVARHARPGRIPLIGVAGAQGSGKTTLARAAARRLGAAHLSLDDVYLTQAERAQMGRSVHPLFAVRGPPARTTSSCWSARSPPCAPPAPTAARRCRPSTS